MRSLGKVQIQSTVNGQIWQAMPGQDYSAVILIDQANAGSLSWFDIMSMNGGSIAFQSSYHGYYVSARWGDWFGKLQLQAPFSADWITTPLGDETFQMVNIAPGEVAFKLIKPWRYVSARMSSIDTRTNPDGVSISVNEDFTLYDTGKMGKGVATVGAWESFKLLGDPALVEAIINEVAVPLS